MNDYARVLSLDPKRADAYYGRALVYLAKHSYDLARADYDRARSMDRTLPEMSFDPTAPQSVMNASAGPAPRPRMACIWCGGTGEWITPDREETEQYAADRVAIGAYSSDRIPRSSSSRSIKVNGDSRPCPACDGAGYRKEDE
jgi:hypothetical protein